MLNYLRDPSWQFVGVVVALLLPAIAYARGRSQKLMTFAVENSPIFSIDKSFKGDFKLSYKEKSISSASFITVELQNRGKSPISRQDFDQDIKVVFDQPKFSFSSEKTKILFFDASGSPLRIEARLEENTIFISPLLVNAREKILLKAVVEGPEPETNVVLRIIGGKSVPKSTIENSFYKKLSSKIGEWILPFIGVTIGLFIARYNGWVK